MYKFLMKTRILQYHSFLILHSFFLQGLHTYSNGTHYLSLEIHYNDKFQQNSTLKPAINIDLLLYPGTLVPKPFYQKKSKPPKKFLHFCYYQQHSSKSNFFSFLRSQDSGALLRKTQYRSSQELWETQPIL